MAEMELGPYTWLPWLKRGVSCPMWGHWEEDPTGGSHPFFPAHQVFLDL